jgi:DNA-binding NarL/FixJ family response regulator
MTGDYMIPTDLIALMRQDLQQARQRHQQAADRRRAWIVQARQCGWTLQAIADELGVSRQRIAQLVERGEQ